MLDVIKPSFFKPLIILVLKKIEKMTFNHAEHINLISEGFKEYFSSFRCTNFSFFSNGIDEEFLKVNNSIIKTKIKDTKLIIYAGNIGEGQGLHKIVPQTAKNLGKKFTF